MTGQGVTLLRSPGLLITGLSAVILREWCHRTRPLGVVCFEVAFVDTPATPSRDIAVIGLYGILFESSITREMPSILTEYTLIKVCEGRIAIIGGRDNSSPCIIASVAGGPLGEPFELAGCVSPIVSALATTAFPFILEVALEGLGE